MSIYDFRVKSIDGKEVTLSDYKNQVMLIVNVASACGYTPQYQGLEKLYQKYKNKGFVILGFPCNQFGGQEPGSETEIKQFCETRFGVTFPLFSKIEVNGSGTHPLYSFLKSEKKGLLNTESIKWNFTKFLVDNKGHVLERFSPQAKPEDLEPAIEKLI